MSKLETQLIRTFKKIERMMNNGSDAQHITRFYSLVHHFEKLNDRYIKAYGFSYNPNRDIVDYNDGETQR